MSRKQTKIKLTSDEKTKIRAMQIMSQTVKLLGAARDTLHAAANISHDGITTKQKEFIKKMIKEDGEFTLQIKKDVELINAFANGTQRNLIDRELKGY